MAAEALLLVSCELLKVRISLYVPDMMLKMDSACVLVTVQFTQADLLVGPTCHNKFFLHLMIVAPLCVLVCVCLCVCVRVCVNPLVKATHLIWNCPCSAQLTSHVHCTFPCLQVTSAWTVPVLHDWHPMSTVPFLALRSLQPELPLFCTTDNCTFPGLQESRSCHE